MLPRLLNPSLAEHQYPVPQVGSKYGEAIAAETGISKKVQALGLGLAEVGPTPFWYIAHPQWLHRRSEQSQG